MAPPGVLVRLAHPPKDAQQQFPPIAEPGFEEMDAEEQFQPCNTIDLSSLNCRLALRK